MSASITLSTYSHLSAEFKTFLSNYRIIEFYIPPEEHDKPKRGKKSDMVCRFCKGARSPTLKFNSDAHKIPVLFGKNYGVSNFECDSCNNFFSSSENDMSHFLGLTRTINAIGKKKVPQFQSPKMNMTAKMGEVFEGTAALEISDNSGEGIVVDVSTGTTRVSFLKLPYTPFNVYKCLLKIALTILPDQYVHDYRPAYEMIRTGAGYEKFLPFAKILECKHDKSAVKPYCILFEKSNSDSKLMSHVFNLYFEDIIYQLVLPHYLLDISKYKEDIEVIYCPPIFVNQDIIEGRFQSKEIDLSSIVQEKEDRGFINMHMDPGIFKDLDAYDSKTGTYTNKPFDPEDITKIFISKDDFLGKGKPI